jgi:hypothetical protein
MQTFEWAIEDIVGAHPDLYLEHCMVMAVALMGRQSASPCEFIVRHEGFRTAALPGDGSFRPRVSWEEETAVPAARVWLTEQPKPIVERAAVALAALVIGRLVPHGQMRVTQQGERADYWLPRVRCALEISGTQHARELQRRHREKTAQLLGNPRGWSGYVVVCCFAPTSRMIRWSFHTHKEGTDEP